jgi:hypothetical protein
MWQHITGEWNLSGELSCLSSSCSEPQFRFLMGLLIPPSCYVTVELSKMENITALQFLSATWFISYSYLTFIIPVPEKPRDIIAQSFPVNLVIHALLATILRQNPVPILLGGCLIQFLYYFLVLPYLSPNRRLPGPFLARYTRLWKLVKVKGGSFHKVNQELHAKYGKKLGYSS